MGKIQRFTQLEVRLGGIYLLERIARDSPEDHWTVTEVLTAFVRERSPNRDSSQTAEERFRSGQVRPNRQHGSKIKTDIQAVLTVLGQRNIEHDAQDRYLDLMQTNLSGADLSDGDFSRTVFSWSDLTATWFIGANLTGAQFINSNLKHANFSRADLKDVVELADTNWHEVVGLHTAKNVPISIRLRYGVFLPLDEQLEDPKSHSDI